MIALSNPARAQTSGDHSIKGSRSNPAQMVTAVAAALAILYFLRSILAPFFLALVITIVIHAISDFIIRTLPKAPHWTATVLTAAAVSIFIAAGFYVVVHGLAEAIPQGHAMIMRLQALLPEAGAPLGLWKRP